MILQKQQRLKEVYEHLRRYYGVHTQTDFAKVIGLTRPAISSAMNGNGAYLTDNLFKRICAAYQGVFNLDYLLNGNGQLLNIQEDGTTQELEKQLTTQQPTTYLDKLIATLEKQVADKDVELKRMEHELEEKNNTIQSQQKIIRTLQDQVEYYQRAQHIIGDPTKYPFPVGSAEPGNDQNRVNL